MKITFLVLNVNILITASYGWNDNPEEIPFRVTQNADSLKNVRKLNERQSQI